MPRVMIPFLSAGFGHAAVAHAIDHAVRARCPAMETQVIDLAAEVPVEALAQLYVSSWQTLLALPRPVQAALYALNGLFPWGFALANERAVRRSLPLATALLRDRRPDVLMATHWGCCHVLDRARRAAGLDIPLYYVYTELAGAYRPLLCGADAYFCMTDDAGEALVSIGVPRDRVVPIGLVVRPEFFGDLPPRKDAQRALGLRDERFTVLFSLGGEGIGSIFPFLDHYSRHGRSAQILVMTGRNTRLLQVVKGRYPHRPDRALILPVGFLASPTVAFAAADAVAGKCGTSFAMEAIVARKPFFVTHVGAPNEATNRDFMLRHGHAVWTKRPADFAAAVESLATLPTAGISPRPQPGGIATAGGAADIAAYLLARLGWEG